MYANRTNLEKADKLGQQVFTLGRTGGKKEGREGGREEGKRRGRKGGEGEGGKDHKQCLSEGGIYIRSA